MTRGEFLRALRAELPAALHTLQESAIAPVDMAQASIGPGMAVFSRYKEVLEADDTRMSVREALRIINAELDEYLARQEGDYDSRTRFALTWFQQHGFNAGPVRRRQHDRQCARRLGRGRGEGGRPGVQGRQGAAAAPGRAARGLGPVGRPAASRSGRGRSM